MYMHIHIYIYMITQVMTHAFPARPFRGPETNVLSFRARFGHARNAMPETCPKWRDVKNAKVRARIRKCHSNTPPGGPRGVAATGWRPFGGQNQRKRGAETRDGPRMI